MRHLIGSGFTNLFRTCQQSAFHLEVHDTYSTPEESEPFRMFLAGEPDDYAWMNGWTDTVRAGAARGVAFQRVRVVTVPHTDYTRWGLAVSEVNIAAGEDVRYLPRHQVDADRLPSDDYWLFDDTMVAYTLFTPEGAAAGAAVTTDPVLVRRCIEIRAVIWPRAIPRARYIGSHTTP
ncbi:MULTISPECIES: DUF6879 family protein [Nocardia]|uniref:DUF6879 family protein n=1 Tax=Nocardia TaxID=1817 RepID=UPI000BEF2283|nr:MULTISPECIES: DUF6879 family protein [Nocardia]MBF6068182.1 hypothetical protein [Nocardia farcinica]MBF6186379.1 hypothetical protein [Nocardia farcinica]MBF6257752.1 hypothetical protein [Nocardia farcinica]MBF6313927.1 hypothetical protein [Nocardia farcinica]MBF6409361.1 hypothetical protein [Nocardia farcinica]